MSGPRHAAAPEEWRGRYVAGTAYVIVMILLAAVAAWPIYRAPAFVLVVGTGSLLGAALAVLIARRGWSGWATAGLLALTLLIVGVPLAVPGRTGSSGELLRGLGELAAGVVVGWKDLLTVPLPVGSYRNLLVPALVVFLCGTCVALQLAWQHRRIAYAAVPMALAMTGFGLIFGRRSVSGPWDFGPLTIAAPAETIVGVAALLASVLWLAWRGRHERQDALQRAAHAGGGRLRRRSRADARRAALGVGMVAVAALGVALVVPGAAQSADRHVLRDAVGPEVELSRALSPLAAYRTLFTDDAIDDVVFTVTGPALPDRIRLATLDTYDGAVFRTGSSGAGGRFARVPAMRDPGPGDAVDAVVEAGSLTGIWMPTIGALASARFDAPRAATLADGFYYSAELGAAVQTAGWREGDSYRLRGTEVPATTLAEAAAPGGVTSQVEAPTSLRRWVDEHAAGTGGAALQALVDLLRTRGYLSHALTDETDTAWMGRLDGYRFVPSTSGHSLGRVDDMFEALLERENEVDGGLVAAIGDDEQFSVAVALIAQELGFPARIVYGARLTAEPGLPVCTDGVCRSGDLAAWVEVRSSAGEWIAVDVTPQHTQPPSLQVAEQRDPRVATEVRPDVVEEVVPPRPGQDDTTRADRGDPALDLTWLWATLRGLGVGVSVLTILVGPLLLIVAAKALRRRGRRRAEDPVARVAGGWEEYVDAAADAGRATPGHLTRTEAAGVLATPSGTVLAEAADQAVFSPVGITPAEADEFWRIVETERRGMATGLWRRWLAAVSLRSFARLGGTRAQTTERGSRRPAGRRTEP
ncbi:transglutaminase domain-containing protein [Microbacterium saccharophilum]|uniref:Transglutaminase domain-containing protein n=1 Tax=Microbacterium saccharophilum TaxID=1213358 RepID=A0A5C8I960_9MICO|nr:MULTISPECIES: transglutaminase domain-containing protein [Microbacterium]TXK15348.1 transglutaminase domain-containing protein [Microbacterium saccharophilum]GEP47054.1 cysteine protease [Microbacterium saccharophilum]SFI56891.1 Transglutaminase-like superfamily protein [Microbacterium saccharophilum]